MKTTEHKIIVAVGEPETPHDTRTLIFGVSKKAWEFMSDGRTHTVDLRHLGYPLQIVLFGGDTQEACLEQLDMAHADLSKLKDIGIKEPTKQ